jgi:hypothetical protein
MFGTLTDQFTKLVSELIEELREIRAELTLLRKAVENQQPGHAAIRPVAKRSSGRKPA